MVLEYDYIITQAIRAFNEQFKTNHDPATFGIEAIPKRNTSDFAFEVYSLRADDQLRLRLYYTVGQSDSVGMFRLEVRLPHELVQGLEEVYSTLATVDSYNFETSLFKMEPFLMAPAQVDFVLHPDLQPLLMENGSFIQLEQSA